MWLVWPVSVHVACVRVLCACLCCACAATGSEPVAGVYTEEGEALLGELWDEVVEGVLLDGTHEKRATGLLLFGAMIDGVCACVRVVRVLVCAYACACLRVRLFVCGCACVGAAVGRVVRRGGGVGATPIKPAREPLCVQRAAGWLECPPARA